MPRAAKKKAKRIRKPARTRSKNAKSVLGKERSGYATNVGGKRKKPPGEAHRITARMQKFVEEYVKDQNGVQAAIRAGYAPRSANSAASQNVRHPILAARISELLHSQREAIESEILADKKRIAQELSRIGFVDIRKFFREDGSLKGITELDDDTAAALSSFEVVERKNKPPVLKIKTWDKRAALVDLGRIDGVDLFVDRSRQEQTGRGGGPIEHVLGLAPETKEDLVSTILGMIKPKKDPV